MNVYIVMETSEDDDNWVRMAFSTRKGAEKFRDDKTNHAHGEFMWIKTMVIKEEV